MDPRQLMHQIADSGSFYKATYRRGESVTEWSYAAPDSFMALAIASLGLMHGWAAAKQLPPTDAIEITIEPVEED